MSSISTTTSVPSVVTPLSLDAVAPAPQTATQRYTPLWLVNTPGSTNGFEALGIRAPMANGDLAVLLAEVSLSLEKSVDENNKNKSLSNLAGLAGARAGFGLDGIRKSVENKTKTVDESTKTLAALTAETGGLLTAQQAKTNEIGGYRSDIGAIKAELAKDGLSNEQRSALQSQLAGKQTALAGALAERETIDIKLAEARIGSLDEQIGDLEAQLARAVPGSDEAKGIQTALDGKRGTRDAAADSLATFRGATKTEAARDAFSASTRSAVQTMTQSLTFEVQGYQSALSTANAQLKSATFSALAVAIAATADFNLTQSREEDTQAGRDSGIERAFEAIAEALDEASKATADRFEAEDDRRTGADEQVRRIQALAQALLNAVGDIVSTLAEQVGSPASPMAPPRDSVANRVRVTV